VPRRTSGCSRDENVRFGSKADIGASVCDVRFARLSAGCVVVATIDAALAQPFGMTRSAPPAEVGGFAGWMLAKQAELYRMLSSLIRAAKADGSAAYTLLGVSFLYGVFHAAGPGHGKAVISSYLVANNETWRRGLVLSFASAMMQALVAIAIVGVAAASWALPPRRSAIQSA
jgi:nickel/cobalt transporter (NicO) family protein